ncbi:MAG: MoaD/ThiS family protein [Nannocystaceae bacterium]
MARDPSTGEGAAGTPGAVEVELYGLPRLLAGAERATVPAGTLAEVLRALADALPGLRGGALAGDRPSEHVRVAIDGRTIVDDPAAPIPPGSVLVMVSAQAGG